MDSRPPPVETALERAAREWNPEDERLKLLEELKSSRGAWQSLKGERGPHYLYRVVERDFQSKRSPATPSRWITTLEIRGDDVVRRSFLVTGEGGTELERWTETGASLGTHGKGALPLTIDAIYDRCFALFEERPVYGEFPSLALDADRLLQACFVKLTCDDCLGRGHSIDGIEFLDAAGGQAP